MDGFNRPGPRGGRLTSMPLRMRGHRVIEYCLDGDFSAHYTAWDRREVTDDGQVTAGHTVGITKGSARFGALIRFYLPGA